MPIVHPPVNHYDRGAVQPIDFMESSFTGSLTQLALCDDIIGWVKSFLAPVEISDEELALDAIDEVGPGGTYLLHKHTRRHARERWEPRIFDRASWGAWEKGGGKTAGDAPGPGQSATKGQPPTVHGLRRSSGRCRICVCLDLGSRHDLERGRDPGTVPLAMANRAGHQTDEIHPWIRTSAQVVRRQRPGLDPRKAVDRPVDRAHAGRGRNRFPLGISIGSRAEVDGVR